MKIKSCSVLSSKLKCMHIFPDDTVQYDIVLSYMLHPYYTIVAQKGMAIISFIQK